MNRGVSTIRPSVSDTDLDHSRGFPFLGQMTCYQPVEWDVIMAFRNSKDGSMYRDLQFMMECNFPP
jgi:hypothetical protein